MSTLQQRLAVHFEREHPTGFDGNLYARLAADFLAPELERRESEADAARQHSRALDASLTEQEAWSAAMERRLTQSSDRVQRLLAELERDPMSRVGRCGAAAPRLEFNDGYVDSIGTISGTPLDGTAGTTSHAFTVTDSSAPTRQTRSRTLSLTIALTVPPLLITTGSALPKGIVGQPYSVRLLASGGTLPFSWSIDRALPPGLTLNTSTGEIEGTPTATSNISFNCTVRDSTQPTNLTNSKLLNIQVTN